jgi:hypothetical protein
VKKLLVDTVNGPIGLRNKSVRRKYAIKTEDWVKKAANGGDSAHLFNKTLNGTPQQC